MRVYLPRERITSMMVQYDGVEHELTEVARKCKSKRLSENSIPGLQHNNDYDKNVPEAPLIDQYADHYDAPSLSRRLQWFFGGLVVGVAAGVGGYHMSQQK